MRRRRRRDQHGGAPRSARLARAASLGCRRSDVGARRSARRWRRVNSAARYRLILLRWRWRGRT
ncbi:MAG: hypothetical protein C4334_11325 [Pyrinomonas sp.]